MTDHLPTPPDLVAMESSLCDLASRDARTVPTGLEERIFSASRRALTTGHADNPEAQSVIARIGPLPHRWATPVRIAAGIALVATVATAWLAIDRTPAPVPQRITLATGVELTLDDWTEVELLLDDGLGDRLDTLYAETALVTGEGDEADWRDFELSMNGESL